MTKIILLSAIYMVLYFINFSEKMKVMGLSYNSFNIFGTINFIVLMLVILYIGNVLFSEKEVKYVELGSGIAVIVIAIIIFAMSGRLGNGKIY